jgi:hypothetical protein
LVVHPPYPNPYSGPGPLRIDYDLPAGVEGLEIKVFSLAMRRIQAVPLSNLAAGRHSADLDPGPAGLDLSNGLYYIAVEMRKQGRMTRQTMNVLIAR